MLLALLFQAGQILFKRNLKVVWDPVREKGRFLLASENFGAHFHLVAEVAKEE